VRLRSLGAADGDEASARSMPREWDEHCEARSRAVRQAHGPRRLLAALLTEARKPPRLSLVALGSTETCQIPSRFSMKWRKSFSRSIPEISRSSATIAGTSAGVAGRSSDTPPGALRSRPSPAGGREINEHSVHHARHRRKSHLAAVPMLHRRIPKKRGREKNEPQYRPERRRKNPVEPARE